MITQHLGYVRKVDGPTVTAIVPDLYGDAPVVLQPMRRGTEEAYLPPVVGERVFVVFNGPKEAPMWLPIMADTVAGLSDYLWKIYHALDTDPHPYQGVEEAVSLAAGWAWYGGGYATPRAMRVGRIVHLSGLVQRTGAAIGPGTITITNTPLSARYRAVAPDPMAAASNGGYIRCDVSAAGAILFQATVSIATSGWVSLGGLAYPVAAP